MTTKEVLESYATRLETITNELQTLATNYDGVNSISAGHAMMVEVGLLRSVINKLRKHIAPHCNYEIKL